jgi:hypothetical protein
MQFTPLSRLPNDLYFVGLSEPLVINIPFTFSNSIPSNRGNGWKCYITGERLIKQVHILEDLILETFQTSPDKYVGDSPILCINKNRVSLTELKEYWLSSIDANDELLVYLRDPINIMDKVLMLKGIWFSNSEVKLGSYLCLE